MKSNLEADSILKTKKNKQSEGFATVVHRDSLLASELRLQIFRMTGDLFYGNLSQLRKLC